MASECVGHVTVVSVGGLEQLVAWAEEAVQEAAPRSAAEVESSLYGGAGGFDGGSCGGGGGKIHGFLSEAILSSSGGCGGGGHGAGLGGSLLGHPSEGVCHGGNTSLHCDNADGGEIERERWADIVYTDCGGDDGVYWRCSDFSGEQDCGKTLYFDIVDGSENGRMRWADFVDSDYDDQDDGYSMCAVFLGEQNCGKTFNLCENDFEEREADETRSDADDFVEYAFRSVEETVRGPTWFDLWEDEFEEREEEETRSVPVERQQMEVVIVMEAALVYAVFREFRAWSRSMVFSRWATTVDIWFAWVEPLRGRREVRRRHPRCGGGGHRHQVCVVAVVVSHEAA